MPSSGDFLAQDSDVRAVGLINKFSSFLPPLGDFSNFILPRSKANTVSTFKPRVRFGESVTRNHP